MATKSFSLILRSKISNFKKKITPDSDKSISIRSLIFGSISQGVSHIKNVLESDDVHATIKCLQKLNFKVKRVNNGEYKIYGKGLGSAFCKKGAVLNFQNSGTAARLICGLVSTTPNIKVRLLGDKSLRKRNMQNLINLLNRFGASFYPKNKKNFPLTMISSAIPIGITYEAGISAQLKSACLIAGLNSHGTTKILEKFKSRDHSEIMISKNKKVIKIKKNRNKLSAIQIFGKKNLSPFKIKVSSDPSSAAFFTALTLLKNNSILKIKDVGLNPRRIGFYKLLMRSGAKIKFLNKKNVNQELVGDIFVKSSSLKPMKSNVKEFSTMVDEFPILFVLAALTPGVSVFKGIGDLANKESNRILEMKKILEKLGVKCKYKKDHFSINGAKFLVPKNRKINVPGLNDHRICMSAAILSLVTGIPALIKNFETVRTSSPSFLKLIKYLGGNYEIKKN
tara:strand:+ start:234 stop:1589 length:1356 start_codon:yes stop_codon:yes gene_type:complete